MKKMTVAMAVALICVAGPILAAHANPWATETDSVNSQYHDSNQARSADTPGEDEMRGVMVRAARGKLDVSVAASSAMSSQGRAAGAGSARGKGRR